MTRMFHAVLCFLLFCIPASAAPVALSNEANGIKLPPSFTRTVADQYVDVQAECKGPVTWLITSPAVTPKYTDRGNNLVTVGVPNAPAVISIYAVGLVDGKLTSFVRTDMTVLGADPNVQPQPPPAPSPTPPPAATGTYHVSIVEDATKRTPELGAILDSPTINEKLPAPQYKLYDLSINSDVVQAKGLTKKINDTKTAHPEWAAVSAWLIVQRSNGAVTLVVPVPKTEDEMVTAVKNAR